MTTSFFEKLNLDLPEESLAKVVEFVMLVEEELREQVASHVSLVENVGDLTRSAGGKRLRPALVYLSAASTGREFELRRAVRLGACMELIHMATLIHDDVIDDADTRRGKPTSFSVFGTTASILGGDVLLAKAMAILAEDGDLEAIRMTAQAVVELAEGEVRELELRGEIGVSEGAHFEVLRMKTASFIECCCRVGGRIAGATEREEMALGVYGNGIGMAFQIADDILDFRGDHAKTGKPRATDFREGQATLPLIDLLDQLTDEEKAFVESKFGNGVNEEDLDMVIGWMHHRGSFGRVEGRALGFVTDGVEALRVLPDSAEKKLLSTVADFVVGREA